MNLPLHASLPLSSRSWCCYASLSVPQPQAEPQLLNGNPPARPVDRKEIRLGLPSKGRMSADTLELLKVNFVITFSSQNRFD